MEPPNSHSQGTERLASHHQEETLSGCIIFVAEGPNEDQGHYIRLEKGEAVIGSHDSCDLVLHDGVRFAFV